MAQVDDEAVREYCDVISSSNILFLLGNQAGAGGSKKEEKEEDQARVRAIIRGV